MPALLIALLGAGALVSLGDLRQSAAVAVPVLLIWGAGVWALPRPRGGPGAVLVAALLVRLILLASPISLSDDVYRYLWEGRVVLSGGNPFVHAPADAAWDSLGPDPFRALVNHPSISTIYPPVALWLFAAVSRVAYHPLAMKAVMGLFDALVAWGIAGSLRARRRSLGGAWLYALIPLGAVESAGSAHLEAAALLGLVLAIRAWDLGRSGLGWAALGAMFKIMPGVLIPTLWRRSPWLLGLALVVGLVAAWPFLDAGPALFSALINYVEHWSFNGGLFPLIALVAGRYARPLALALGAGVVLWAWWRRSDPAQVALWSGGAFVLLSPTVHPWYVLWAWVPALIVGVRAWNLLAVIVPLSYVVLVSYDPATSKWSEPWWPVWIEYLPFLMALLWESTRHRIRPGPWASGSVETPSPSPSRTLPVP